MCTVCWRGALARQAEDGVGVGIGEPRPAESAAAGTCEGAHCIDALIGRMGLTARDAFTALLPRQVSTDAA
jgi:hypothetical protein